MQQFLLSCANVIPEVLIRPCAMETTETEMMGGTNKQPDEELVGLQNYDP